MKDKFEYCSYYEFDPAADYDFKDCPSCIHDRRKDCPFGIYSDNVIRFLDEKK
jgi:hypothetical protein